MSQVVDYFGPMLGRRRSCWADVGPLAAMFSRLLGTFAWRIIMVVLHIAFCALCTHISMFVFICSLTIILCVLKTVQPTPLVVEPGRYKWLYSIFTAKHCWHDNDQPSSDTCCTLNSLTRNIDSVWNSLIIFEIVYGHFCNFFTEE